MALSMLSLACAAAVACWDDQQAPLGPPRLDASVQRDTGLAAVADAWIEQDLPNANHGTSTILRIRLTGKNRGLLRWDQQTIQQAVGPDSLLSATLEITYSTPAFYWEQGAKSLFLHRLTQSWTEAGATWNCAVDEVPTDGAQNCGGSTAWNMTTAPPIVTPATASFLVQNGSSGTVQLNVTADVRAWLAGTATNHGWLLKKELENISGLAEFGSRESGTPPRLVLSILSGDTAVPAIPTAPFTFTYDTTRLVTGADSSLYQRDVFTVSFKVGTPGPTVQAFFARYSAVVIGGMQFTRGYVIRVPDPITKAAWDSLLASMNADPSIAYATPKMFRFGGGLRINGRWPIDGSVVRRADWFSSGATDGTRGLRAARFPLAWGCETGDYGSAPVDIAVVDYYFANHPDVDSSVVSRRFPGALQPAVGAALDSLNSSNYQAHGLVVSSVVGARTDNGIGIAGAAWRARLRQQALAVGTSIWADVDYLPDSAIALAAQDGARILLIASDHVQNNTALQGYYAGRVRAGLKSFLAANPRNLVIQAAENANLHRPVADFANALTPDRNVVLRAVAGLFASGDADTARVIVVTALNANGTGLWANSNELLGATGTVAAPGQDVRGLLPNTSEGTLSGTSVAAPLVAGAAALLLAFDPTITGAEVKRLLTTDTLVNSQGTLVSGAAGRGKVGEGTVLDAYSPLVMRARAAANLPVCGYPVRANQQSDSVVLDAPAPARRAFAFPSFVRGLSVAQGGRQVAVWTFGANGGDSTVVLSHTGTQVAGFVDQRRSFLERDTLIARRQQPSPGVTYPQLTIRGPTFLGLPNNELTVDLFAPVPTSGTSFTGEAFVAPSADYALLRVFREVDIAGPPCQELDTLRWHLVQINGTGQTLVRAHGSDICQPGFVNLDGEAGWSHDGRRAVLSVSENADERTTTQAVSPPSALQGAVTITLRALQVPTFSSDDSLVEWLEWNQDFAGVFGLCKLVWRAVQSPYGDVASTDWTPISTCPAFRPRRRDNAPPMVARSGGATAFDLFRPGGGFVPRFPSAARGN